MPISLACECGRALKVKDEYAGKQGRCPACGKTIAIPAAESNAEDAAGDFLLGDSPGEHRDDAPNLRYRSDLGEERAQPERPSARPVVRDAELESLVRRAKDESRRGGSRGGGRGVTFEEGWFGNVNAGMIGGLLMIAIAVVWFVVGLAAGFIFFYPPILLVLGVIAFFKGLFSRGE